MVSTVLGRSDTDTDDLWGIDSLSGAKLASYGYPNERAKKRRLELHGPEEEVPLESTGRM